MSDIVWDDYRLTIELTEPLLGTIPKDPNVWTQHVKNTSTGEDEAAELPPEEEERGWTGFYTDEQGRPIMKDYQLKGFLKEAGNILKEQLKVRNLRSHIDNTVFVFPRTMVLADAPDGVLERPLRAMTQQGPRVTVVRSDLVNPGRTYDWTLKVLKGSVVTEDVLKGILAYGEVKGLGQWRNGSYGRFTSKLTRLA